MVLEPHPFHPDPDPRFQIFDPDPGFEINADLDSDPGLDFFQKWSFFVKK